MWQGKRVRLRAIEPSDLEFFVASGSDEASMLTLSSLSFPASRAAVEAWLQSRTSRKPDDPEHLLVIEDSEGQVVGSINSHHCNPRFGSFKYGIGIASGKRRQGYAREAILMLLGYFFRHLRYHKAWADVYAFNEASARLHDSLGFTREGRLREMLYIDGAYHDILVYGMTAGEYEQRHLDQYRRFLPTAPE